MRSGPPEFISSKMKKPVCLFHIGAHGAPRRSAWGTPGNRFLAAGEQHKGKVEGAPICRRHPRGGQARTKIPGAPEPAAWPAAQPRIPRESGGSRK